MPSRPVDILIPIYNARECVQECIGSVLEHSAGDYRLVLVDDASTDAKLAAYLDRLARENPRVLLIRTPVNGGFVCSANRGFRQSEGRDVLLLNSDTVVTAGFLTKLQDCACADEATGIVTPFSNNATICSIPRFCEDNPLPEGIRLDDYAELVSRCSLKRRPELVTAVGFCMYIKAAVFERIGYFDEIYGRGFGEENDFCERAKRQGIRIRLCDDLFIAHKGKASFGGEGKALESKNMKTLLGRFPSYLEEVAAFCRANPLAELQENIQYHLRRRDAVAYPAVLYLVHASPFAEAAGGAEHHLLDFLSAVRFPRALAVYREPGAVLAAEVLQGDVHHPLLHRFALRSETSNAALDSEALGEILNQIVDGFGVTLAHIHHLFRWPIRIWRVFEERRIPFFYTVHDFYCVCPSHNLFDHASKTPCPCDLTEPRTTRCLRAYETAAGLRLALPRAGGARQHREEFAALLAAAAGVFFPSRRALELVQDHHRGVPIKSSVVPHGIEAPVRTARTPRGGGRLRAGVLGYVNYVAKGADNYLDIVRRTSDAEVEWHFFGDLRAFEYETRLREAGRPEKLVLHGFYRRAEITALLERHHIDVVVMAPAVEETFSFTLSEALCARVPVISTRMGAIEERLKMAGLADWLADSPAEAAGRLIEIAKRPQLLEPARRALETFHHPTTGEAAQAVRDLYGRAGAELSQKREPLDYGRQAQSFQAYWAASPKVERPPVQRVQTQPGPWWYRLALRCEEVAPASIQRPLRRHFMARRWELLACYSFSRRDPPAGTSQDVECLGYRMGCARFRSRGRDPYLVLPPGTVDSQRVQIMRFRIRCRTEKAACAQLFWVHEESENFSERKSILIPLEHTRKWQDMLVDLDHSRAREEWTAGPRIVRMRLDPLDCEGTFELDSLVLARVKQS